jgi:transposase
MEDVTLTRREQSRLQVLNGVLGGQLKVGEVAEVLGLSERHVWRILAAYRRKGAVALAHGNRGRQPAATLAANLKQRVVSVVRERYAGVNHTHLSELLAERERILMSRSTLRRILVEAGLPSPRRRRPPRHRCRRQRMPQEGMLVQMDGSYHDWLEGRGPWLTLLLAVDDATGTIPFALFREHEDSHGYFLLLEGIVRRCGIPLAVYTDRHAVFQHPGTASMLPQRSPAREREPTQFGRALGELAVHQVFARSPEAKGRVERAAGTFQDRLVAELRLAGARTMAEANRVLMGFLPRYNQRFSVPPADTTSAYRALDPELDLGGVLCFKHRRKVARDNTVRYDWHTLQLLPQPDHPSYAGVHVEVQERLDGQLVVCCQGRTIPTREAPLRPGLLRSGDRTAWNDPAAIPRWLEGILRQNEVWKVERSRRKASPQPAPPRQPTPRQQSRWRAVQMAKRRGLSLRAIARVVGISRNTVRKYLAAGGPAPYPQRRPKTNGLEGEPILTESLNS